MRASHLVPVSLLASLCLVGCVKTLQRQATPVSQGETLDQRAPYLKVHTRRGEVYVLSPWTHRPGDSAITGSGRLLDPNRRIVSEGDFIVPLDSAVLFETNVARPSTAVAVLGVLTGVSAAVTVYCLTNPKACFGSCPTFYVTDGTTEVLQAEGFSASIAPSLEATDVDHLYRAQPDSGWLDVRMTNEALETHVIRFVNVLVVDRGEHTRVFADTDGRYWSAISVAEPTECRSAEGDCLSAVQKFDGVERTSLADSADLAARETVELTFVVPHSERLGIVIGSRQSLLPTFLLYQALAWLGTSAGHWLAKLERGDQQTANRVASVVRTLGGIEILLQDEMGEWQPVGEVVETGPLGVDVRLVPIPRQGDSIRVQLRMAKGAWRLEYVAIAELGDTVAPIRLRPEMAYAGDRPSPEALEMLRDSGRVHTMFPGDEYLLRYRLLDTLSHREFFLESRGYYLEWMRNEWVAEENLLRVAGLFLDPGRSLRALAPEFKRIEPSVEQAFWNSKYVRP